MGKYEVEKNFRRFFYGGNITAVMKNYGRKYSDRNLKKIQESTVSDVCSGRISHGAGLLTRVIRRIQPDERRRELTLDPWGTIL
jgi:hypothetical protein